MAEQSAGKLSVRSRERYNVGGVIKLPLFLGGAAVYRRDHPLYLNIGFKR